MSTKIGNTRKSEILVPAHLLLPTPSIFPHFGNVEDRTAFASRPKKVDAACGKGYIV